MGKPTGKKKAPGSPKPGEASGRKLTTERSSKAFDEDTAIFINMSQELKEEGNKLYQKHDHEGAMLKFEKALKLLPKNHIDVAYLRTNMAACYMQMGLGEYPRAINECNLALEVSPKYSKALLKRAKCYESLNRLDLAYRDVNHVLSMEPNNLAALEILESVQKAMTEKGLSFDEKVIGVASTELSGASRLRKVVKEKMKKKKTKRGSNEGQEEKKKGDDEGEEEEEEKKKKGNDDGEEVKKKGNDEGEEEKKKCNGEGKEEKKKGNDEGKEKNEKKKKKVENKEKVVEEEKDGSPVVKKTIEEQKVVMKDVKEENAITKTVKLVLGEDIRWAQMPVNCSIGLLRDIVRDRFPGLKGVLVKYKDQEGDLITITSTEELRLAESSGTAKGPLGSLRFYVVEVSLDQEPAYDGTNIEDEVVTKGDKKLSTDVENGDVGNGVEVESRPTCIEDWIIEFARLFKNHVGFDSDTYLDLHELGMKLYSEAMEDSVTSEDAQKLFDIAADKFQEMTALALFNWGNVHFSKARKRVFFSEDAPKESLLAQVKIAYNWANEEYMKAGMRYRESLNIKPDFYEGLLALGLQQFERAKLCWYYAIGSKIDLESGPSEEVLDLYNKAEDSMERGMQMWEEMEEQRLNGLSKFDKNKEQLKKMGLDGLLKELSAEEAAEQAANMSSQIYLLWGTMLYERSVVEYKLELPTWEECLEVAVEKFELAGASPTDLAVMIKNHCSNETALEGMGFKIDEIVQAWNEMYDAKRWEVGVPSFRLEPLFRRRVPKLHFMLEHA